MNSRISTCRDLKAVFGDRLRARKRNRERKKILDAEPVGPRRRPGRSGVQRSRARAALGRAGVLRSCCATKVPQFRSG